MDWAMDWATDCPMDACQCATGRIGVTPSAKRARCRAREAGGRRPGAARPGGAPLMRPAAAGLAQEEVWAVASASAEGRHAVAV
jgi:hypothetical protein